MAETKCAQVVNGHRTNSTNGTVANDIQIAVKEFHVRHRTEFFMLRSLQVLLFLISYSFSQTILDFDLWSTAPLKALLNNSLFLLLFVALVHVLPKSVPLFLSIMAMPPYVDHANLATFRTVLEGSARSIRSDIEDDVRSFEAMRGSQSQCSNSGA